MTFHEFIASKKLPRILYCIFIFSLLLLAFRAGSIVGSRNAALFYQRIAGHGGPTRNTPPKRPLGFFMNNSFSPSHGTFGVITAINASSSSQNLRLEIQEQQGDEKTVIVSTSTILVGPAIFSMFDIKKQSKAIVIGAPNDNGEIEAKLIKIIQ